jgi:amino acid adenylation domain-containing protein
MRQPALNPSCFYPRNHSGNLCVHLSAIANKRSVPETTLTNLLRSRMQQDPARTVYTWLVDGERPGASFSHADLDRRARSIACQLQALNLQRNRALLLYGPGLSFVESLFGCFYADVVAVPVYTPGLGRDLHRIEGILRDADCGMVLTTSGSLEEVSRFVTGIAPYAACMATDTVEDVGDSDWLSPGIAPDQTAYLQYTSGSTSAPKGVMVTHANVLENLKYIAAQGGFDQSSVSINWLPHFHDMGLIYGIFQPLFSRFPAYLFSPAAFIHRPLRWLTAISRYGGTHCGGPNFAYDLCVDRVSPEECSILDLNSWRVAFNGAEPVLSRTLERFARYFAGCGFRRNSFYPVYGLAEASLKVTSGEPGSGATHCRFDAVQLQKHKVRIAEADAPGHTVIGCGRPGPSHEVVIVDPDTAIPCGTDKVGEIWVSGPSVAAGYWRKADETDRTFRAFLNTGRGPYLRTGDLGFLYNNELFITGRLKDCIIIRGRNHYPQDIEKTAEESHPALRRNGSAAFSIEEDGREALVVISELNRKHRDDLKEVVEAVRRGVAEAHEVQISAIVLIRSGALPKTSSGKVQRHACKAAYLGDTLPVLEKSVLVSWKLESPASRISRESVLAEAAESRRSMVAGYILHLLAHTLHHSIEEVAGALSLAGLGMDSLAMFDLRHRIETDLHITLSVRDLLDANIDAIAAAILLQVESAPKESAARAEFRSMDRPALVPLSSSQEQVWLIQRLFPESCAYNELLLIELNGVLDLNAFRKAVNEVARRHEILRTNFVEVEGESHQVVQPFSPPDVPVIVLDGESAQEQVEAAVIGSARRPFQLDREPPVRFSLFQSNLQKHLLLLVAHHIVCDGVSLGIFVDHLGTLYDAYTREIEPLLPELQLQYADYAVWERDWLKGAVAEKQLGYWRRQLANPPVLSLPTDYPRPTVLGDRGGRVELQLPVELTESIKELGRRHDVTLFMVVLTAFQLLLSKYSRQQDIAVGSAVANRNLAGTENIIGFFVNTVVLRTKLDGVQSVGDLLRQVGQTALEAYENQDVPFAQLVKELRPDRDLGRTPLFQTMLVFQPPLGKKLHYGGLRLNVSDMDAGIAKFELTLRVVENAPRLRAFLEYNQDLFESDTVCRMATHLEVLLQRMAEGPTLHIDQLSLLSGPEQKQLLVDWNQTEVQYPQKCVHELFQEQVRRTPENVALVFEGEKLTYRSLNRRANHLASHLKVFGVGPEVKVGLCVERSPEMVIGLLAILKAGGAYVPLDPHYPATRLAYMIQDAQTPVLVMQPKFAGLAAGSRSKVVILDEDWARESDLTDIHLHNFAEMEHLAYVIYTSGSTGKPKGVMVSHRAISNHLQWRQRVYPLSVHDHFLHKASLSFDISAWEILAPLLAGARLIMAAPDMQQDSAYLADLMVHAGVTVAHFNPSMLRAVLEEPAIRKCHTLQRVFCGGEAMTPELQELFLKTLPAKLHNQYGPTETTVDVLFWDCRRDSPRKTIPVGRPIDNTMAYILGPDLQPVPAGVVGELCIGGMPVARGYLNCPDLTADRFIPDGFGLEAGARLFKTGDLARYDQHGNIEFIGRADRQVKVRGFRIELEEVESVLCAHPAVKEAAVVIHESGEGNKRLAAHLVSAASREDLRSYLNSRLPEYMVPSAFVLMDALPRTPTGKIDRKALPETPLYGTGEVEGRLSTPVEELLAGLWAELIGMEEIGPHANFFELGGHSVLATRMMSRLRDLFQVELPLRAVFEFPTLKGLAEKIEAARQAGKRTEFTQIERAGRDQPLVLSFAQERMWLLHQLRPASPAYNMPIALRVRGPLNVHALEWGLGEIVRRHKVLRARFPEQNGKPTLQIAEDEQFHLQLCNLGANRAVEDLQRLSAEEALAPFDLRNGPLRTRLWRLSEEDHVLLVTMHHIVSDGWSTGIIVRELNELYRSCLEGKESPLPDLQLQYSDFAAWQRKWLQGEVLEFQLEYWRRQLEGIEALELPTDRPRPAVLGDSGASLSFQLSEDLTRQLKEMGKREGATLFMCLLAAFQVMLSKYTGQQDIAVGTAVANRNRTETEGLIGFFVNTLVLRTSLDGSPTFREILKRVRNVALEAYQHQDVPFEKLVAELAPERDLTRAPLFQVMLVLQNTEQQDLCLPGVEVTRIDCGEHVAKFDLMLAFDEKQGAITGAYTYACDLFERQSVNRFVEHLLASLAGMISNPDSPVSELCLLNDSERQQVLVEWNSTHAAYPERCVHELFEEQVRSTPAAIAVVHGGQSLSYADLSRRANQLGHFLRRKGVGAELRVGICMDRSLDMIVAMLAVWKAGGAYVPLDPAYPHERLILMVEDSQAAILLTERRWADQLPACRAEVVCLEEKMADVAAEASENVEISVGPWNLAYVIYTSGSTGRPKGVAIEHRSASMLMHWARDTFSAENMRGVLASTSICFDLSVFEIFAPLSWGGTSILAKNALALPETTGNVTLVNTVPSAMAELVRMNGIPASVRTVNLAGEALHRSLVDQIHQLKNVQYLYNLYGPSEDTTYSIFIELKKEEHGVVPIGRPLPNTQAYVLDDGYQPVPTGARGELYLGGAGLARGYLGRPELTADRFVPSPFSEAGGERLYRTGDLVRWRDDGNLEFLGRIDHQVKLRGYRIELGEVEAAILAIPKVEQATVMLCGEDSQKFLVAYVVADQQAGLSGNSLRGHLKGELPDYMVPSAFVMLETLPLTPNGKIDRKALPAPTITSETEYVAPSNEKEEILCAIFAEVLEVEKVGMGDNFFRLGGHSLLATQVVSRVRSLFNIELPLQAVFEAPTVSELLLKIEDYGLQGAESPDVDDRFYVEQ